MLKTTIATTTTFEIEIVGEESVIQTEQKKNRKRRGEKGFRNIYKAPVA